jgi:hypothetical protein
LQNKLIYDAMVIKRILVMSGSKKHPSEQQANPGSNRDSTSFSETESSNSGSPPDIPERPEAPNPESLQNMRAESPTSTPPASPTSDGNKPSYFIPYRDTQQQQYPQPPTYIRENLNLLSEFMGSNVAITPLPIVTSHPLYTKHNLAEEMLKNEGIQLGNFLDNMARDLRFVQISGTWHTPEVAKIEDTLSSAETDSNNSSRRSSLGSNTEDAPSSTVTSAASQISARQASLNQSNPTEPPGSTRIR